MERTLVKLTLVCLATVALFVALFGFGCGGRQGGNSNGISTPKPVTTVKCGTEPDRDVLKAIYAELEKEKLLAMQEWQFNIMVVGQQIKISGWAKEPHRTQILTAISTVAPKPDCQINDDDFEDSYPLPAGHPHHRAACWPGYKACGDICIPQDDPCHVLGEEILIGAKSNSNSNSNANTNTNSNRIGNGNGNSKSNSNGNVNR